MTELVRAFVAAQYAFDLPRIKALTSDDYVEISQLGEVDLGDKMLGFYAPERKTAGPVTRLGDATVTMLGNDAAIVLTSI